MTIDTTQQRQPMSTSGGALVVTNEDRVDAAESRRELFCLAFIETFNAAEAARRAGYAAKNAKRQGFRLLEEPEVQE
ncbi:MAG: terminase small subunit [bacterium]|nr:terminase small subunit [bacterium]